MVTVVTLKHSGDLFEENLRLSSLSLFVKHSFALDRPEQNVHSADKLIVIIFKQIVIILKKNSEVNWAFDCSGEKIQRSWLF